MKVLILIIFGLILQMAATAKPDSVSEDIKVVTAMDTEYQLAVLRNDVATMDRILADDFVLVLGNGTVYKKADLINAARDKTIIYERQEDSNRTVRVFGDTAIVTALLWEKFVAEGKTIEKRLWFSDVYVRTPKGWKYVFGQASMALPTT